MAGLPTVGMDETSPSGEDYIREGDDRIREYKTQNREVLEVDHVYPESGSDVDAGKHKQLSLIEQADVGTGESGKCALGAQTVGESDPPELVFTDEEDQDVQITDDGTLNADAIEDISATAKTVLVDLFFPIGFIYVSTVSTNPGTYLGGTWTAFGAGKVLISLNAADGDFDTAEKTGGAKTVSSSNHTHNVPATSAVWGTPGACSASRKLAVADSGGDEAAPAATSDASTGASGGESLSIVQSYIVVYMWKRTA